MLDGMTRRAFKHWSIFYATRFNKFRQLVQNEAAMDIQQWYRRRKQQRGEAYKKLVNAVKICIQRRKAIKFMLRYEIWSRKALIKIVKGLVQRRRLHMAARSIQRIWRWIKWCRRVRWKMIRLRAIRRLQRFWRMEQVQHIL